VNASDTLNADLVRLRTKAEKKVKKRTIDETSQFSEIDIQKLTHEVAVLEIVLKMQNEKLQKLKKREEETANEKYIKLYDFVPIGCVTLSGEKEILNLNLSGAKMLGHERAGLIKSRFDLFVSEHDKACFEMFFTKTFQSKTITTLNLNLSTESKSPLYVQLNAKPSSNGENCLMTMVDITDIKTAELEIEHKNEELSHLVAEKDKFFSILAHDLRSPFNVLLGTTQLLMDHNTLMSLNDIHSFARIINKSVFDLFQFLEDLLRWSSLQMGKISFDPKLNKLLPLVSDGLKPVVELISNKSINFRNEVPGYLTVFADVDMLKLILRNLVGNAVKFTKRGGRIILSARQLDNQFVEISVRDKGIGMKKNELDNLFLLDKKVNRMGTEGEASTGLGLILCKEMIEKHGGKIWAESEPDRGSTFYFTIPSEKIDKILGSNDFITNELNETDGSVITPVFKD
jgi:PAS domain S-box-containing protein